MIGIIDADFEIRAGKHFPNIAAEKISSYYKSRGKEVKLIRFSDLSMLKFYDDVYCCKVFTDTQIPEIPKWVKCGGTGFYFDKAPALPLEIEHTMPDYNLYNERIGDDCKYWEFRECSIGFLTRGCFRKCKFCVNQNYNHVFQASPLSEFLDVTRPKICLLDDNFFGFPKWRNLMSDLIKSGKRFRFKQGLDERLLDEEKCDLLFSKDTRWYGDYTFAFDNVEDYELIKLKLDLIRRFYNGRNLKFYVLVGFKSVDEIDLFNAFRRINLLKKYDALPYLMRYQSSTEKPYKKSEYVSIYTALARWCNQPQFFRKLEFIDFLEKDNNQKAIQALNNLEHKIGCVKDI